MNVSINVGHRERLRRRFLCSGMECFAEHEIVELLLTFCIPRKDVKPVAKTLIRKFKSVRGIFDADIAELSSVPGMGTVAPTGILFIKHLMQRYFQEAVTDAPEMLTNYEQLGRFWGLRLSGLTNEVFEVAFLDTHLRLLPDGVQRISEGIVDRTQISVRKIMEHALNKRAHAIIIAHNHPSGSPLPSDADAIVTQNIKKMAELLDIRFVDHIIVGQSEIYSFRRSALMPITRAS